MSASLVAFLSGASAAGAVVSGWEAGSKAVGKRRSGVKSDLAEWSSPARSGWARSVSVRSAWTGSLAIACVALGLPAAALPASVIAWVGVGTFRRLDRRRRRAAAERAFPGLASALGAALAAGLKPSDALRLASLHREDPIGLEARACCDRIAAGAPLEDALSRLASGFPGTRLVSLCSALEVATRRGTDATEAVVALARAARAADLARCRERAAKAGPVIQLVVALGLVPSVLLLVAAAALAGLAR